ncbi:hypothetical protein [Indiicoccus explosivorum]|uniref:hypothetical protein n=1 Tax=Indiicoccus explosivorum TaxID=1917864 RepID=UPI001390057E|nr:hypothetical protein [Indiicoccus explosivorum]
MGQKHIPRMHIYNLEARRADFTDGTTADVCAQNLIGKVLKLIDVYNTGDNFNDLKAASVAVQTATLALKAVV